MVLDLEKAKPAAKAEGHGAPEHRIEKTPEMIEAGVRVFGSSGRLYADSSRDGLLVKLSGSRSGPDGGNEFRNSPEKYFENPYASLKVV